MTISINPGRRRRRTGSRSIPNELGPLESAAFVKALETHARKALAHSGPDWNSESDVTIAFGQGAAFSLQRDKFTKIRVSVNVPKALACCRKLAKTNTVANSSAILMEAVYSAVRLWAGYYDHCPLDLWRHSRLCQAAAEGGFETLWPSPAQWRQAEAIAGFFERSVVGRIITKTEGPVFARGLVYEQLVNRYPANLLTNLFFAVQVVPAPRVWQALLEQHQINTELPAADLLPQVLQLLFSVRVRFVRGRWRFRASWEHIPPLRDWPERVRQLAKLLIPYMTEGSQPQPNPVFEPTMPPGPSEMPYPGSGNPSMPPEHPFDPTASNGQFPGLLPGRENPPARRYDFDQLDRYYCQQAEALAIEVDGPEQDKPQKPDSLTVGYLDAKPASLTVLASGQIEWFRTRVLPQLDGSEILKLYQRTEPLEAPLGGDEPAGVGVPHLLLLVDSSGSMKFNPHTTDLASRGKYDIVLRACYGIFKHIEQSHLADCVQVACINFSGNTIESGWHPYRTIEPVKRVLLRYQGGGTVLSPPAIQNAFLARPGKFLGIIITDGCIGNVPAVIAELKSVAQAGCDLVLLHVGPANDFTNAVKAMNCPVHILSSADNLVGLTLQIAKDKYQLSRSAV